MSDIPSNQMSPQLAGLVNRLQEWSRNCLIDGFKMDAGEPTLQALLREAYLTLMRQSVAETPAPLSWVERNRLRTLVDNVWNEATESPEVPDARCADRIIDKWLADQSPPKTSVPRCEKHGVELAWEGDGCWECSKEER